MAADGVGPLAHTDQSVPGHSLLMSSEAVAGDGEVRQAVRLARATAPDVVIMDIACPTRTD